MQFCSLLYAIVLEERVRCKWNHSAAAAAAIAIAIANDSNQIRKKYTVHGVNFLYSRPNV